MKGDIARALFYMTFRYTGDVSGEPTLCLKETTGLITSTTDLMGRIDTLLKSSWAVGLDARAAGTLRKGYSGGGRNAS